MSDQDDRNETSGPEHRDASKEQRNGAVVLLVMGALLVAVILLGMFAR